MSKKKKKSVGSRNEKSSSGVSSPVATTAGEFGKRSKSTGLLIPCAAVFIASFCVMALELAAARLVAPALGASLYTWTSVIGVVLGGLSIGAWLGGALADRRPGSSTLALLFLAAAPVTVLAIPINALIEDRFVFAGLPWNWMIALHVALVFVVPALLLGMIAPAAAKLALDVGGEKTGRIMGNVYAWGALGSILGTYATGFYLIPSFGTRAIIWSISGVLLATGILLRARRAPVGIAAGIWIVLAVLGAAPGEAAATAGEWVKLRRSHDPTLLYEKESAYSLIRVHELTEPGSKRAIRTLYLGRLLHNKVNMADPADPSQYPYLRIMASFLDERLEKNAHFRSLFIGGGGYVLPRYVLARREDAKADVVEIDPEVTRVARDWLGLSDDPRLRIFHEDGRLFTRRAARESVPARYDLICLDAFHDYSMPWQTATREFFEETDRLLADDGVLLINMIDAETEGFLLGAVLRTLETVFPHVEVLIDPARVGERPGTRSTYVLVASRSALASGDARADGYAGFLAAREKERYRARGSVSFLTDDFAPIDALLAPLVIGSTGEAAGDRLLQRAYTRWESGDVAGARGALDRFFEYELEDPDAWNLEGLLMAKAGRSNPAMDAFRRAHALKPDDALILNNIGLTLLERGEIEEAHEWLDRAVAADPEMLDARVNLATTAAKRGDLSTALTNYLKALSLDPDQALESEIRFELGLIYYSLGANAPAAAAFARAAELDPDNSDAHFNAAVAYSEHGEGDSALVHLDRSIEIDPGFADALALRRALAER